MDRPDFLKRVAQYIKNTTTPKVKTMLDQFLDQCTYVSGVYDQDSGFQALEKELQRVEAETKTVDRLYYMALPPSVFIPVANGLKKNCYTTRGVNRLIVEKPFGMDLESSRTLSKALGALYREDEVKKTEHFMTLMAPPPTLIPATNACLKHTFVFLLFFLFFMFFVLLGAHTQRQTTTTFCISLDE